MPVRLEGRPGVSVPVSPSNTNSESRWRYQRLSDDCKFGMTSVRTPNSAPFARTSGVTGSTASPVFGSTCVVVPRPAPIPAHDLAVVVLIELIPVDRIVQVVGEIRIELQVVSDGVRRAF